MASKLKTTIHDTLQWFLFSGGFLQPLSPSLFCSIFGVICRSCSLSFHSLFIFLWRLGEVRSAKMEE